MGIFESLLLGFAILAISASRRCARVSPRAAESHTWKPLMSIIQPPDDGLFESLLLGFESRRERDIRY